MPHALILGGTGAIGRATARRLLAAGWSVEATGRDPARLPAEIASAGGRFAEVDRAELDLLTALVGDGFDRLVDCLCYTAVDAEQLPGLAAHAGSTVMISSKAVYVDDAGARPRLRTGRLLCGDRRRRGRLAGRRRRRARRGRPGARRRRSVLRAAPRLRGR